jgi:hypothetical protein
MSVIFRLSKSVKYTVYVYVLIVLVSLSLTAYSLSLTIVSQGLVELPFCLESHCVKYFLDMTSSSFVFIYRGGLLATGVFTFISIALLMENYISNLGSHRISNNVSQYNHFSTYIHLLLERYDRIPVKSISSLRWYQSIYASPTQGKFEISDQYYKSIAEINNIILSSNLDYVKGGSYRFREHQNLLSNKLFNIGITIHTGPRTSFHEAERQVVDFINETHSMFIPEGMDIVKLEIPKYK